MPKKTFALEPGSSRTVDIEWRGIWKDFKVSLDGQVLGTMNGQKQLQEGDTYPLQDGSVLAVKLEQGFGSAELKITRDGQPLPGTDSDPRQQLESAAGIVFFIAGLNIVLGLVAELLDVGLLLDNGLGWGSVVFGVVFLGLGLWARKGSRVALILAIALFAIDGLLGLYLVVDAGGTPGTGGVVMRVLLIAGMIKGVMAAGKVDAAPTT